MSSKRGYSRAFGSSQTTPAKKKKSKTSMVPRASAPKKFILGKTTRATLRYSEKVSISSAAVTDAVGTHVFSANGCFDPNVTGIGSQPRGFDQLMALYDHYTVTKARIKVRFLNTSASTRPYVAIAVRDSTTAFPSLKDMMEYDGSIVSKYPVARNAADQGKDMCAYLETYVDIGKFLGRKSVLSDPECKGSASSNPSELVQFHVMVSSTDAAAACAVNAIVTVEYDVILHEPKLPASS